MVHSLSVLGSTGSIGRQSLAAAAHLGIPVSAVSANRNIGLLEQQARQFSPRLAVVYDESAARQLRVALADTRTKVVSGMGGLMEAAAAPESDCVITAVSGSVGLRPTLAAIDAGKRIGLANKETLVVAGELITDLAMKHRAAILPVDSEHSAIFQCLVGEGNEPDKILLTASGGPFRQISKEQLQTVTAAQALQHPTWHMGDKITIDSATMINKGFEVIEAKWLFGIGAEKIEVLVHPQSIVHSAVQFCDGSVKAQLGLPDMRLPIQYALSYPQRLQLSGPRLDLLKVADLTFERPDLQRFPCLPLAYDAIRRGGNMPCILNAANEVANLAFRQDKITFPQISEVIGTTMQTVSFEASPSLDTYRLTDSESRRVATEIISNSH